MEASINNLQKLVDKISDGAMDIGLKIVLAIVIYIVGSFIIRKIINYMF